MIIVILVLLGLCFGSFVNAMVWRLHMQSGTLRGKKPSKQTAQKAAHEMSILRGRSMCPHCRHSLAAKDLIPVLSWLSLGGKCRYCHKPISWQYPLVESLTTFLFLTSYIYWPAFQGASLETVAVIGFGFWLVFLVGLMALAVYDLRWMLLPDRIIVPLLYLAVGQAIVLALVSQEVGYLWNALWGLLIGGGLFYVLFQVSQGKWIGGGDVKLGALLGLIVGGAWESVLLLFTASLLGSVVSVPLLLTGRASRGSHVPFGPFLIIAAIIVQLFGASIITWYRQQFLYL